MRRLIHLKYKLWNLGTFTTSRLSGNNEHIVTMERVYYIVAVLINRKSLPFAQHLFVSRASVSLFYERFQP